MATWVLTPARLEQRRAAGKACYLKVVERFIRAHPDDPDLAARGLTGWMRLHAKLARPKPRAVTRAYVLRKAAELGLPYPEPADVQ